MELLLEELDGELLEELSDEELLEGELLELSERELLEEESLELLGAELLELSEEELLEEELEEEDELGGSLALLEDEGSGGGAVLDEESGGGPPEVEELAGGPFCEELLLLLLEDGKSPELDEEELDNSEAELLDEDAIAIPALNTYLSRDANLPTPLIVTTSLRRHKQFPPVLESLPPCAPVKLILSRWPLSPAPRE